MALRGYRATKLDIEMAKEEGFKSGEGTVWDILSPKGMASLVGKQFAIICCEFMSPHVCGEYWCFLTFKDGHSCSS